MSRLPSAWEYLIPYEINSVGFRYANFNEDGYTYRLLIKNPFGSFDYPWERTVRLPSCPVGQVLSQHHDIPEG